MGVFPPGAPSQAQALPYPKLFIATYFLPTDSSVVLTDKI